MCPEVSTATLWTPTLECWATVNTGLLHKILVDQGSAFEDLLASVGAASKVGVENTDTRAHSYLGIGERCPQPLQPTFRKLSL